MSVSIVQLDTLIGQTIQVVLNKVSDFSGNMVTWPVAWSFVFADYGRTAASVYVTGLKLSTKFSDLAANSITVSTLQPALAGFMSLGTSRIASVTIFEASDGLTAISFVINPSNGTGMTAVTSFTTLVRRLVSIDSSVSRPAGALNTVVKESQVRFIIYAAPFFGGITNHLLDFSCVLPSHHLLLKHVGQQHLAKAQDLLLV
jgi:hypothetical protein